MSIGDIFNGFIQNWSNKEELYFKIGTATEINEDDFTFKFTPIDEKSIVEDVRMKVIVGNGPEAFVIVPKENSKVVVAFHSNTVGQCAVVKEAEKVLFNTNIAEENAVSKTINVSSIFNINCDDVNVETESWDFNSGTFGGLIKISELETKLNDLISELNTMKDSINSHTHPGVRTGTGVSGISSTNISDFTDFNKNDFENEKIKHG